MASPLPTKSAVHFRAVVGSDEAEVKRVARARAQEMTPAEGGDFACDTIDGAVALVDDAVEEVADALETAGLEWRVLKGVATSRLIYTDTGERSYGDLDVLVRGTDFGRALIALEPLTTRGDVTAQGPVRERQQPGHALITARGVEIDLHRAVRGSMVTSRLPAEPFFADSLTVSIGGRQLLAPSYPVLFAQAALHYTHHNRRLSTAVDIARLAMVVPPRDETLTALVADRTIRHLCMWAIDATGHWCGLPATWEECCRQYWKGRPALKRRLDWIHGSPSLSGLVNVFVGDQRVRRFIELMWPSSEYLRSHGLNRKGNLSRVERLLLGVVHHR